MQGIFLDIDPVDEGATEEEGGEEEEERGKEDETGGRKKKRKEDERIWGRFEYEFLPDFCYTCGRLGHLDKDCKTKLKRGQAAEFGRWMKYAPEKPQSYYMVRGGTRNTS